MRRLTPIWNLFRRTPPFSADGYWSIEGEGGDVLADLVEENCTKGTAILMSSAPDLLNCLDEILNLPVNDDGTRAIPPGFLDVARNLVDECYNWEND